MTYLLKFLSRVVDAAIDTAIEWRVDRLCTPEYLNAKYEQLFGRPNDDE